MVGICRGGQFLNVMSGGCMYQDVKGHVANHFINDRWTNCYPVTSTHHQMMLPLAEADMFAYAINVGKQKVSLCPKDQEAKLNWKQDCEGVYYPDTQSMCFQPHPEFVGYPKMTEMFFKYIDYYFFDGEM